MPSKIPGQAPIFSRAENFSATTVDGGGTYWFSYLTNLDAAFFGWLKFGADAASQGGAQNTGFGTTAGGGVANEFIAADLDTINGASTAITTGVTMLVVGRVDLGTDPNVLDVWFNIDLDETEATIGAADSSVSVTEADMSLGNFFSWFVGNVHDEIIDELRLGDSLADVIPGGRRPISASPRLSETRTIR